MGFKDKPGNLFGDSKSGPTDSVKPAGQVLRENGPDRIFPAQELLIPDLDES
jgi:hypothetical protein